MKKRNFIVASACISALAAGVLGAAIKRGPSDSRLASTATDAFEDQLRATFGPDIVPTAHLCWVEAAVDETRGIRCTATLSDGRAVTVLMSATRDAVFDFSGLEVAEAAQESG